MNWIPSETNEETNEEDPSKSSQPTDPADFVRKILDCFEAATVRRFRKDSGRAVRTAENDIRQP